MKDAECAESKKNKFSDFYFYSYIIFVLKSPQFSLNFHDNSKNKNRKIDFSFVSAHRATSTKIGSKLRSAYP